MLREFTIKLLFIFTFFISLKSFSANFYWVNGSGDWSDYANHWATTSGGSTFHNQIPSPVDDVFFDDNSTLFPGDTVTIDSTLIYAKSLNYTGTGSVFLFSNYFITFEITTTLNLNPGFSYYAIGSEIKFVGTGIHTLNTGNDTLFTRLKFAGTGEYILNGELHCHQLDIQSGKFRSNNNIIRTNYFSSLGNPEIFLETSIIYVSETVHFFVTTGFYPIHAENATFYCKDFIARREWTFKDIYCIGSFISLYANFNIVEASTFDGRFGIFKNVEISPAPPFIMLPTNIKLTGTGSAFNKININVSDCQIDGELISDTLIILAGSNINVSDTLNINSFLSAVGNCSGYTSLSGTNGTIGKINMSSGVAALGNNYFSNIHFIGSIVFNANNSFSRGNVSGVTVFAPPSKKLYWINGTGNWNDVSHWSTISGTSQDNCVPTEVDTVIFDNNSVFNHDSVIITLNSKCKTFIWSSSDTASFNYDVYDNGLSIYQSIIVNNPSSIIFNFRYLHFYSNSPGNIINTNGAEFYPETDFSGSGEWDFQSTYITNNPLIIRGGTLRTNGNTIKAGSVFFDLEQHATFHLDTSLMEINTWNRTAQPFSLIIDAVNANFKGKRFYSSVPMNSNNFIGYDSISLAGPSTFNDMETDAVLMWNCNGNNVKISDSFQDQIISMQSCNLNKLELDCKSCVLKADNTHIDTLISIKPGQKLNVDRVIVDNFWKSNGSCSGYITLSGFNYPDTNNIRLNGSYDFQYIIFKGLTITGNVPVASTNSIFDGPSQGITLYPYNARTLYWVNGNGSWGDNNHWSISSGGIGGECIPTKFDNVIFDVLSGSMSILEVDLNHLYSYCNDIHFIRQGKIKANSFNGPILEIHGDLETDSLMSFIIPVHLISDTGINLINSRSQDFGYELHLEGEGAINLIHNFRTNYLIDVNVKEFYTQGYKIECDKFILNSLKVLNIYLDTSIINTEEFKSTRIVNSHFIDGDSSIINSSVFMANNNNFNIINSTDYLICDTCEANLLTGNFFQINNSNIKRVITSTLPNGYFAPKDTHIEYIQLNNSEGEISQNGVIDTLIFNQPGQDIDVQFIGTVANHMEIISAPGFPTRLQTNNPVTINYSGDTLCTDFIYIRNINLTGSGLAYAGINSFDLGGNSGWNFTQCPNINSIDEQGQSAFIIYPNPTSSNYFIAKNEFKRENCYFILFNMYGQIIDKKRLSSPYTEMNSRTFSSGIYSYQIRSDDKLIQNGKIVFD